MMIATRQQMMQTDKSYPCTTFHICIACSRINRRKEIGETYSSGYKQNEIQPREAFTLEMLWQIQSWPYHYWWLLFCCFAVLLLFLNSRSFEQFVATICLLVTMMVRFATFEAIKYKSNERAGGGIPIDEPVFTCSRSMRGWRSLRLGVCDREPYDSPQELRFNMLLYLPFLNRDFLRSIEISRFNCRINGCHLRNKAQIGNQQARLSSWHEILKHCWNSEIEDMRRDWCFCFVCAGSDL